MSKDENGRFYRIYNAPLRVLRRLSARLSRWQIVALIDIVIAIFIVLIAIATTNIINGDNKESGDNPKATSTSPAEQAAIETGKQLSGGYCNGSGGKKLSSLPMKLDDFAFIEPYGLMIGGHVTPIDHQYFSPTVFNSPKDTYEVRAMGDAKLVNVETHPTRIRLVFSVSCTLFYYYDLLTSVEPGITQKSVPIDVKAGQLIGHIGGQTLDFAVWDTTRPLKGFVVPEHYKAEGWKLYTVDPLEYYTDDVKQAALSKYIRITEPLSGKIDYDIDGKLVGNWFEVGTNGYGGKAGEGGGAYWQGHLSFAPDHYDPSSYVVSVGYLAPSNGSGDNQFSIPRDEPDPTQVGSNSGLIKYSLKSSIYLRLDGSIWDRGTFTRGLKVSTDGQQTIGCALVQMTGNRSLEFETFLGQDCQSVDGFKSPKKYER
jgi:hypothetical protein